LAGDAVDQAGGGGDLDVGAELIIAHLGPGGGPNRAGHGQGGTGKSQRQMFPEHVAETAEAAGIFPLPNIKRN
jgi:hypothetical protein